MSGERPVWMRKTMILILVLVGLGLVVFVAFPFWVYATFTGDQHSPVTNQDAFLNVKTESFVTETRDGVTISGWFLPGDDDKAAVILAHGYAGNRLQMLEQARFLNQAKYPVILFDFRNHGMSGGDFTSFGYFEKRDLLAVTKWVSERLKDRPIVVWGVSMGAACALMAAKELTGLSAVIAESSYDTFENSSKRHFELWSPRTVLIHPALLSIVFLFYRELGGIEVDDAKPIQSVTALGGLPILFVAGRNDELMRPEMVQGISQAHPGPARFYIGEGGHAEVFAKDGKNYRRKVLEFLSTLNLPQEP